MTNQVKQISENSNLIDPFNRRITYLRLSVTDRCDLRCTYCMPEKMTFLNKKEVIVSYMEGDDDGTYLRIKKVSTDGKVSKPITISKIDGGRGTGVPQLEILDDEIFIVWTVYNNENNQLKTVRLNSKDV